MAAAQRDCDQNDYVEWSMAGEEVAFNIGTKSELNYYTTKIEAMREAQLSALTIAAVCLSSIERNVKTSSHLCKSIDVYDDSFSLTIDKYSIMSEVTCASEEWIVVHSSIKALRQPKAK